MRDFVKIADAVDATTRKLEKLRLISEFFKSLSTQEAALAARFLSAHPFDGYDERTLGVGGANLSRVIAEAAGKVGENKGNAKPKERDPGENAGQHVRTHNRE